MERRCHCATSAKTQQDVLETNEEKEQRASWVDLLTRVLTRACLQSSYIALVIILLKYSCQTNVDTVQKPPAFTELEDKLGCRFLSGATAHLHRTQHFLSVYDLMH